MHTEHFDNLPGDKRRAILNAAYACFGRDGYKKTAMSEIAAGAGISKAALFYYFGTKKDLYQYLYRFASDAILAHMTEGTEDFFECIQIGAQAKLAVVKDYPDLFAYMMKLASETDAALLTELKEANQEELRGALGRLYAHVDWGRLQPGIDPAMVMNLAGWISQGIATAPEWQGKPWQAVLAEHNRYMSLLKQMVYKEAYW